MKRWLLFGAILLVLAALVVGWYLQHSFEVLLPVANRSDQPVRLLFYGEGLEEHVLVSDLQPRDSIMVTLTLKGMGPIRIKAESGRASIDAQLVDSNSTLRRAPLRFEVQSGNQFVLVPL